MLCRIVLVCLLLLPALAYAEPPDPFSLRIDGVASSEILPGWKRNAQSLMPPRDSWKPSYANDFSELLNAARVAYSHNSVSIVLQTEVFRDTKASVQYLSIANNASTYSPLFEEILPLDTIVELPGTGPITLHFATGSQAEQTDFQPMQSLLEAGKPQFFAPNGGRSSDGFLPYFNLASQGGGVIIGIGWTGQWKASFARIDDRRVRVTAGMEHTRIRLHPNETIRTPSILLLRWEGTDWIDGQNALRRFMLRHFTPQSNGAPVAPPIAASPHAYIGFNDTTEANLLDCINRITTHALPIDTFWLDAGWGFGGFPRGMGNPDPDAARFPNGLKPVSAAAHAHGLKYLQWFEPERVMTGTWLEQQHPEWLLSPADLPANLAYHDKDGFKLLNLGDDAARSWITNKVLAQIRACEIDVYRQDFNMYPLYYWRNNEDPERQGISEIRYIEGLYKFLDDLRAGSPSLVIDNCASGGRRLDFEMMCRSLPLWRSDNCWEPIGEQCMTYGLSLWLPVHGVGSISLDPYDFRSGMGSNVSLALDYRSENPEFWEKARVRIDELKKVRPFFSQDFYPLTAYTAKDDAWIAWQYHDPVLNSGIVQAFRRPKSGEKKLRVKLRGLVDSAQYTVVDLNGNQSATYAGDALTRAGVELHINAAPGSTLLTYAPAASRAQQET